MYNATLKERFLKTYPEDTAMVYRNSLIQIDEAEQNHDCDCFNFSVDELDAAFKTIRSRSLGGVRTIVSPVLEYIRWANQQGFVKSKIDITPLFNGEKLKEYIWDYASKNRYIYREELYAICDNLINFVDKSILVLVFEGVLGKDYHELTNLKFSDIDFGTGEMILTDVDGVVREVTIAHQKSLDILKECKYETTYLIGNGDVDLKCRMKEFDLLETPYVIRKIERCAKGDEMSPVSNGFLLQKIIRFFRGKVDNNGFVIKEPFISDAVFLSLKSIYTSGFFDCCMELEKQKGGTLETEDYKKACIRYGINLSSLQTYKGRYLDWKDSASE